MTKISLLIPCYNEESTIAGVINDFRREIPEAEIYGYDNNSSDQTVSEVLRVGLTIRREYRQGKGHVVRSMFREIDADIYVMVDGDNTYPASCVRQLMEPVLRGEADMVTGDRISNGSYYRENRRSFHYLGNRLVRNNVNHFFNVHLNDIMTGYRVFSRRFIKSFPVLSSGFQLETEMTIFALNSHFKIHEIAIDFCDRPEGSFSKLDTFRDGLRVLFCIFNMYRHYKPLNFFSILSLLLLITSLTVGIPVIIEYIKYSYVYKVPSAILASGLIMLSVLVFICGLLLDTLARNERCRFEQMLKQGS